VETIKTAVVVVLLLAVLYGVYVVLNRPDLGSSPEVAWDPTSTAPPVVEEGTPVDPNAVFVGGEQPHGIPDLPGMTPTPMPPFGEDRSQEVTDQVPTPAVPSLDFGDEMTSPPDLTSVPLTAGHEKTIPEGPTVTTVGDLGSLHRPSGKGAGGAASVVDPAPDPGNSLYGQDESKGTVDPQPNRVFENAWNAAIGQLEKGEWETALYTLSLLYNDPDVAGEMRSRLVDLLDPLAGKVIYSNEHTLERPYEVLPGDTLQAIAERYQVPMTLLQNINGISDPRSLQPGRKLKVLRGPFRAEVDRKQQELVLFLGRHYAGRFAISIGNDPEPRPAEYQVTAKQPGREYYAPDHSSIPAKSSDNPYGDWWIGLGGDGLAGDVCIHGSPESTPLHAGLGCVSLSSADAADVYHILTIGSKVVIR